MSGRREVSCKDFYRFVGHCDLNGSNLLVGQSREGHFVVDYTTADQDGCTAPSCLLAAYILCKLEFFTMVKECLT